MDIVEELRQNRDSGAKRLVSEYKAGLMSLARRFCVNESDAEELVNATFAKVVDNIDDYLEQSAFFAWMCQILTNLFRESVRRKSNANEFFPGDVPDVADESSEGEVYKALDASLLREAIESLPEDIKKAVVLHYFVDMPVRDIAKFLSIPFGTVARRLHLARQILAVKLGAAAKKPGGRALLLALALCGLTALGAAVFNIANNGEAQNMGGAASGRAATNSAFNIESNRLQSTAIESNRAPSTAIESNRLQSTAIDIFNGDITMNSSTSLRAALAASSLVFAAAPAADYTTAITDTTGYVVQNASDSYNQNSLVAGTHFPGGAPIAGKHYLVNNGFDTRTPPTANASNTFKGDSLTLDGGANLMLKGSGSTFTVNNLIVYNALVTQSQGGNTTVTLGGNMTAKGTASAPSIIQGNADGGARRINLTSAISGDATARIKVQHVEGESPDREGHQFYTHFMGNNSAYAGSIEVEGGGNGVCLVGYGNTSFGSSPAITLSQNGKLFGGGNGGAVTLSGAAIALRDGGTIGVYKNGSANVGLSITGGSTISGTGILSIQNSGFEGAHDRRVELADVSISGIDGIVANSILQLGTGYDNTATPITMAQPKMLRIVNGVKAGPVTLQGGSNIDTSNENAALSSLTLESTSAGTPFIRKFLSGGLVTIDGDIVNNLAAGEKIRVDFMVQVITSLASKQSYRILSAANLGDAGVTAADFVATAENTDESLRQFVTNGTFSIEEDGGRKYLVYTLAKKAVYTTATDGYSDVAMTSGGHWSSKVEPKPGNDYFVMSGHQVRSTRQASTVFRGDSLTVLSGGKVAVQGGASGVRVTIADLRLCGGGILTTTTDWGNNLDGALAINGSAVSPAIYETAWVSSSSEKSGRHLTVLAPVSGSGALLCRYQAGDFDVSHPAGLNLRGDNTGFTGQWQIMHPAAQATFASAANFGSASALVLNSNGVFKAQSSSFSLPAATEVVVHNDGAVAGGEDLTNGGTISVDAGLTLTVPGVVSGAGVLRKTGGGTLLLDGANTLSGTLEVRAGLLGGAGSVESVSLADGAGFAVDATQAAPFEIGTLALNGDVAIEITDYAAGSFDRVAVANVGAISGELPQTAVPATLNGRAKNNVTLSYSGGVLYAGLTSPFILVVR